MPSAVSSLENAPAIDLGQSVAWRLDDLLDVPGGGSIDSLLDQADVLVEQLQRWRGTIVAPDLTAERLASVMAELAVIVELVERAANHAQLGYSTDTADAGKGAAMAKVNERATAIGTKALFIELEWAAVPDEIANALADDDALAFAAHHLRVLRRTRPHLLSEPEEKILAEKSVTGASAWVRLFEEQTSAITVDVGDGAGKQAPLEVALARLQSPERDVRRLAFEGLSSALGEGLRTRVFIYNTLLADKSTDDRLRSYPTWISSRNLANQASDASVAALVEAVTGRNDIARGWYRLKAQILGVDQLAYYDRMAALPIEGEDPPVAWGEARDIVLDAYHSFSRDLGNTVQRFFDESWIDAPIRPGKRGGAFCSPAVPNLHPYVLLNYTGTRHDVLTLAHELGHGLHFALSHDQSVFHHVTPLTVAETASVFGETVTFGRLLDAEPEPSGKLRLLAASLDGAVATVFRQVAMWRFEDLAHRARRSEGELSAEHLGELWRSSQSDLLGDSVDVPEAAGSWWSYIPHFIHTPGYVYAYAFGQLLATSVYRRYLEVGPSFVPKYLEMLAAGGSEPPEVLAARVGCDLADPGFWDAGLSLIADTLTQAQTVASTLG